MGRWSRLVSEGGFVAEVYRGEAMRLLWATLAVGFFAGTAQAEDGVWCRVKDGVFSCTYGKAKPRNAKLYSDTAKPAADAPAGDTSTGSTGVPPKLSRAEQRRLSAFSKPSSRAGATYAPIPAAPAETPRFSGDEPEDLEARERLYLPYIEEAAALYDIPEPFLRAVIRVESNFRYRAKSEAGAMGLMQIMPSVVKDMGVPDPWDPRANVLGGTRLLRALADRYEGDMVKVLSAYHAGVGSVAKSDGIPFEATESYVRSVLDRYYAYKSEPLER
jgi:soluble lytic murein transglycosylase-like protein